MPVGAEADQRNGQAAPADALIGRHDAAVLDPVGPLDHERQRHAERRDALRVAQQRRDVHVFAGAIDAALGVDEGVEPGRHLPAGHAAVGQIEGRRLEA